MTRTVILGSKSLCLNAVERLAVIAPGTIAGIVTYDDSEEGQRSVLTELRETAKRLDLTFVVAGDRQAAASLPPLDADLVLVLGWYWLIRPEAFAMAPYIGVHYSRLPAYRGGAPLVWQMINGESEAWYSIFTLTPGMDEGELWGQGSVPIGPTDYVGDVSVALERAVLDHFDTLYPALLDGTATSSPQCGDVSYAAARVPEDGLIDWTQPAYNVETFIRAQSKPYPGAFTYLDRKKLTIWRAERCDVTYYGTPGQVARVQPDGVTVICGNCEAIRVTCVGWEGTDRRASEVLRSIRTRLPEV